MVPDKIDRLCQRARQAIERRDWDKAKQAYLMALGLKSDLPGVHYGLATVYFQLRELTSAAHHFREVTRLDPLRAGAFVNLGAVLNLLTQYDEAITVLRHAIRIDPQRTEGYYNLGLVHRRKGQPELALQAYREALRLNPRMADAHLNLANLLLEKGQYRQAAQHYEKALELRPNWENALEGLAAARAAVAEEGPSPAGLPAGSAAAPAAAGGEDLERIVDPAAHRTLLETLHHAALGTEDVGRLFERVLVEEIDPAIKELSYCLLHPEGPRSEFDSCVNKFDTALTRMQLAQQGLDTALGKFRNIAEHFPNV